MSDDPPGKSAQRPVWLRAWTVAVARMPETGWTTGRWRRIGLSCLGIVVAVVAAGVIAGGVIGVGALEVVRMMVSPDPLIAREAP